MLIYTKKTFKKKEEALNVKEDVNKIEEPLMSSVVGGLGLGIFYV